MEYLLTDDYVVLILYYFLTQRSNTIIDTGCRHCRKEWETTTGKTIGK